MCKKVKIKNSSHHFFRFVAFSRRPAIPPLQPACLNILRHLELGGVLGELKDDGAASESPVDLGVRVQAVVDATALLLVEDDLEGLGAVLLGAETLADDLDGVDEVGQDGVVDSSQGARTGALLGLGVARAAGALGAGEDAARGQDQDVAVGELLLQLTGEAMLLVGIQNIISRSTGGEVLTAAEPGGSPAGMGRGQK